MSRQWVKNRIDTTVNAWSPIVAPIECDYVDMRNAGSETQGQPDDDIYVRTDVNNPGEEDTISVGFQDGIVAPYTGRASARSWRFSVGDVLGYAQAKSGTQRLVVTFLK